MLGGGMLLLGVGELVVRLDEPAPLFFWLPTLWGGGSLVLLGVFGDSGTSPRSITCVIGGAMLGFLPTAWTVVMPLLSVALIVLTLRQTTVENRARGSATRSAPEDPRSLADNHEGDGSGEGHDRAQDVELEDVPGAKDVGDDASDH